MISFFVKKTVYKPVTVIMLAFLVAVFGTGSLFFLPVDFYPPLSVPKITIATTYNGLPAKEIQELITIPIEDTVSSLPGLKKIKSSSLDGISIIEISFSWGTDIQQAGILAREMADVAALELPDGASKPMVLPVNPTEEPILILGAFPQGTMEISDLKRLCDREIKSLIQQASGVGSVQILGGLDEEILVEPDPYRLGVYSIPFQTLSEVIQATNTEIPAGSIEQGIIEYIVKTESMIQEASDINNIPIFSGEDATGTILIRDLAQVTTTTADRTSFVLQGSHEGIGILIRAQGGYSPVSLSKNVREKIQEIQSSYNSTLTLSVLSDSSIMIKSSISDLLIAAALGILIAFFVIVAFLRKVSSSCIMTASIPLSILTAIALFPLAGIGINTMSIGGLAIGIGMLVDNSVVVLENIQRKARPEFKEEVIAATIEIAGSTIGSTITSLIVFLPLFFLPGIIGVIFKDLAWAVSFSLVSSFIVSISVVPVLYCHFGSGEKQDNQKNRKFRSVLRMAYRKPAFVIAGGFVLLAAGTISFFNLEKDWLNTPESNQYLVTIALPAGTSIEHQMEIAKAVSLATSNNSGILESFFYGGGEYNDPYYITGKDPEHETIYCQITTAPNSQLNTESTSKYISALFTDTDTVSIIVTPASLTFNEILGINTNESVTFSVPGKDYTTAFEYAEQLKNQFSVEHGSVYPQESRPRIVAKPKRNAVDALQLDNASIARILGSYISGTYAGSLKKPEGRIPIKVQLAKEYRNTPLTLSSLAFPLSENAATTLGEAVSMERSFAPPVYYRDNRRNVVYLSIPSEDMIAREQTSKILTDTNTAEWNHQTHEILLLFAMSIFLMYILLGIQFNSFILPLFLLSVVPFGFSGVFTALFISGNVITLNGILGSLVVIGIVVNNGIIFYDNYSSRITRPSLAAIGTYRGANDRIRAIAISFFTTILALVPIALDITGRNPQSAMAAAIIGGILASTLVSIFAFPVVFNLYFRRNDKRVRHDT